MVEVTAGAEAAVVATAETEEELLVGGLYHGHRVQRLGHPGRPGACTGSYRPAPP